MKCLYDYPNVLRLQITFLNAGHTVVLPDMFWNWYCCLSNWPTWCTKSSFIISLLNASTCFEHYVLIIRRSKLYYTAPGIVTPVLYNKFIICLYMFRTLCAHHQEVKIVLFSIWYRHTCKCYIISLLYASTCFEHYVLIIRRSKLYYSASGIVTPVSVI